MDLIIILIFVIAFVSLFAYVVSRILFIPIFMICVFVSWLLFKIRLKKLKKLLFEIFDKTSVPIETAKKILNLIDNTRIRRYLYYEKRFGPVMLRYDIIQGIKFKKEFVDLSSVNLSILYALI